MHVLFKIIKEYKLMGNFKNLFIYLKIKKRTYLYI